MTRPVVLLVAKPWRGGLADYLFQALRERQIGAVSWIASYPASASQALHYRLRREHWREQLMDRINAAHRDAALFVNLPPQAGDIAHHPGNVLWLTDAPSPTAAQLAPFARIFVSDPGHADAVRTVAGPDRFGGVVPFACLPALHRPEPARPGREVCFIGNRDPRRDEHLRVLLASGVAATVVGNYFAAHPLFWRSPSSFRPRVAASRMGAVYARHRLSLNVHARVVEGGTNMRSFECAAYGIPQLVEHRPGLETYFEPEREIAVYRQPDELGPRLAELLADPETLARMAARARERALAEHTYARRLEMLLPVA